METLPPYEGPVPGHMRSVRLMRAAALWRLVRMILIGLGAFAGGIGVYAGSRALWSLLVLWWPWLLAGVAAVVALGAWWLWWIANADDSAHVVTLIWESCTVQVIDKLEDAAGAEYIQFRVYRSSNISSGAVGNMLWTSPAAWRALVKPS